MFPFLMDEPHLPLYFSFQGRETREIREPEVGVYLLGLVWDIQQDWAGFLAGSMDSAAYLLMVAHINLTLLQFKFCGGEKKTSMGPCFFLQTNRPRSWVFG